MQSCPAGLQYAARESQRDLSHPYADVWTWACRSHAGFRTAVQPGGKREGKSGARHPRHLNRSGNDGTVTRFGWKAQNKSLVMFAGEAYNVEQGVSNELFPKERSAVPGCIFNGSAEDATNLLLNGGSTGTANEMSSDMINFALFMRLSAPPAPAPFTSSAQNGAKLFNTVGCALCHTPTLTTGPSRFTGMSNVSYNPYSDFALHHMGTGLADGIVQGGAGSDQFRTAPLWGVGQRLSFIHDGRTSDLLATICAHSSNGSEANAVINRSIRSVQVRYKMS